jgi:hypothetical protein
MSDQAVVVKNKHGDFVVEINDIPVSGGYFSRMEDYAYTEARKFAQELNSK